MVAVVSYGCSPQKRAKRMLRRAETLAPEMFVDTTITVDVQVVNPERLKVDRLPMEFDRPMTTEKDGVTTTVLVTHDTIYVDTFVEADTLTAEGQVSVPIIKPELAEDNGGFFDKLDKVLWMVVLILSIVLIINVVNQIRK